MEYQSHSLEFLLPESLPEGFGESLVCFGESGTGLWWLKLLKKGFRHCFVALNDGHRWIIVDTLLHRTHVSVPPLDNGFDLASCLREKGYTVIACDVKEPPLKMAPISFFTCVEGAKRILGVHNIMIVTPWQLYKLLVKEKNLSKLKKTIDTSHMIR
jgi:hypothetical protein